ncbi:MAG: ABC transporter substrate-binding protein [Deltaproteobacteria bacterium]|nr:ABC transporter substrate-binding protein [Deltaproteobacteria bacterium]
MKIGQGLRLTVLGTMLLLLIAGCGPKAPQPLEKIVLGAETVAHASPVWIAENKGYFREEGLNVEIKEFASGRTALQTMLNIKGIDLVTAAQTPVVSYSFNRNDYAIIGGMVYSDKDVQLLARQDKGIQVPADLKGRTVGITARSSGHFFLGLFLSYYQMSMADVKTVDLEPDRLVQALIEGQVDAMATWEPHIYQARKSLGDKVRLLPGEGLYREDFYFIARKDYLQDHTETVKRFLRAIEKAEAFIMNNREETLKIVGQRLKIDQEILKATWNNFFFRLFLDQPILTALEDEARWAIRNRLTDATRVPNYLDYIHPEVLKEVKPEAVSLAGGQERI